MVLVYSDNKKLTAELLNKGSELAKELNKPINRIIEQYNNFQHKYSAKNKGRKQSMGNIFLNFGVTIKQNADWRSELFEPEKYLENDSQLITLMEDISLNYKIVAVTNNSNVIARRTLKIIGILKYFQFIIALDNSLVSKPNPIPFKMAKEKLEYHIIAVAIEKQDYKTIKQDLEDSINEEKKAKDKWEINNKEINMLEQKTSNIGKAIQKINTHLEDFFGRKEIQLELDGNKKGYIIKRDGQQASNLSESEKTAIAFSYFIVKVQESQGWLQTTEFLKAPPLFICAVLVAQPLIIKQFFSNLMIYYLS